MNNRERFIACLTFSNPDKVVFEPGHPRESTLVAWHTQGLPQGTNWKECLVEILGIELDPYSPPPSLDVDFRMMPQFEEKVLSHLNGHYIVQDWMGAITEISDEFDYTYIRSAKDFVTRKWHRFPVKTQKDWEQKLRWRYNPEANERFPLDFQKRCDQLLLRQDPLKLAFNGPFWQLREWCGFEGLCSMLIEKPDFIAEMTEFWKEFISHLLIELLAHIVPDYVLVNEDMAYKHHSMISPKMVERFLMPCWKEWVALLKSHGVPVVMIDSDGYVGELIPLWIEAGFDGNYPVEVAAGNDIVAYREKYGRQVAFEGGIDKRALAAGGEILTAELRRVVPTLLKEGGFIPGCDHGVPPDISWKNFIEYSRQLARYCGWL